MPLAWVLVMMAATFWSIAALPGIFCAPPTMGSRTAAKQGRSLMIEFKGKVLGRVDRGKLVRRDREHDAWLD
jgi:hypothetical protein